MWKRFDRVSIKTTKNISWLSTTPGKKEDPKGIWTVMGNIPGSGNLLIVKGNTIVEIPLTDVVKVADYDVDSFVDKVKKIKSTKDLEETGDG